MIYRLLMRSDEILWMQRQGLNVCLCGREGGQGHPFPARLFPKACTFLWYFGDERSCLLSTRPETRGDTIIKKSPLHGLSAWTLLVSLI